MKWFCIVGLLELSGCVHIHLCVDFSLFKVHDARCNTSNFKIASIVRSFSRFLLGTCFDECCLMFTIISARGSHYGSKYGPIKKDNMAKARVPDLVQTAHSELFLYIKHWYFASGKALVLCTVNEITISQLNSSPIKLPSFQIKFDTLSTLLSKIEINFGIFQNKTDFSDKIQWVSLKSFWFTVMTTNEQANPQRFKKSKSRE